MDDISVGASGGGVSGTRRAINIVVSFGQSAGPAGGDRVAGIAGFGANKDDDGAIVNARSNGGEGGSSVGAASVTGAAIDRVGGVDTAIGGDDTITSFGRLGDSIAGGFGAGDSVTEEVVVSAWSIDIVDLGPARGNRCAGGAIAGDEQEHNIVVGGAGGNVDSERGGVVS